MISKDLLEKRLLELENQQKLAMAQVNVYAGRIQEVKFLLKLSARSEEENKKLESVSSIREAK